MEKQRLTHASNSKLPQLSELPDDDVQKRVRSLLTEAMKLKAQISAADERLGMIRDELAAVCEVYEMKGFRNGLAGFECHGLVTRKSLSREKLVLHVAADIIDSCYDESKPFLSAKFVAFDVD